MPRCHFDNHEAICFNDGMRQQDYPVVGCASRCNYGTFDVGRVTHQDCSGFDCERCRCSLYGPPKSIMGDHSWIQQG